MKIFQMGEGEWWAGADAETVMKAYRAAYPKDPVLGDIKPEELTEQEMDSLQFVEDGKQISFRERLAELEEGDEDFPCFFAAADAG